jgi:NAD(P)-dependent dehydrogenase (short-subunit alcohol dehydrogenase family)
MSDAQRVVLLIDSASDLAGTENRVLRLVVPTLATRLRVERASVWIGGLKREGTDSGGFDPAPPERVLVCDVSEELSVLETLDHVIDVSGRLDAVFVNAMIGEAETPIIEFDAHRLRSVLDRAVLGTAVIVREAARRMVSGGSICLCVTAPAITTRANRAVLESATAAVIALAKTAALELGPRGVCVTTLCAGQRPANQQVLFGRELIPDSGPTAETDELGEIASVASFLLGPESMFCTGGTFSMDGARRE